MNAELETLFVEAQAKIKTLTERPSNADMLRLYAHFKQATEGDCNGEQPGAFDFVNRAKFDAWRGLTGQSKAEGMQGYVSIVEEILAA